MVFKRFFDAFRGKPFSAWQIEITTRCALACRMCVRQGIDQWQSADMPLDDFSRLAVHFSQVENVILQGWGEPLLHPDLAGIIRTAKSVRRPPAVGFVTSGKGLDVAASRELVRSGLDFIGFSFAGATAPVHQGIRVNSDFGELVQAVRSLEAEKRRMRSERPRTHLVFLMLRDNMQDLALLPALGRELGVRQILLINLIHVVTAWQDEQKVFRCEGRSEFEELLTETVAKARETGVSVRRPGLSGCAAAVCEEDPLRNLYVSVRGEVAPCVYLHPPVAGPFPRIFCGKRYDTAPVSFGNLFRQQIGDLWLSDAYREFRGRFEQRRSRAGADRFGPVMGADPVGSSGDLPEAPGPCRTCHKLLGL
jgi:MoaA/NifB/PqqE/SkfB family radical SAM enzyme